MDYSTVNSMQSLIFSAASCRNCQTITIEDDNILEGTEKLFATLCMSNDVILEPNVTEILILEDPSDSITIGFENATYTVEEGLKVEVCTHILNGTLEIEAIVSLSSLKDPADFLEVSEELTFAPMETRLCRNVMAVQDSELEANEEYLLHLSTNQSGVILNPGTATVTILSDDGKLCIISFFESSR